MLKIVKFNTYKDARIGSCVDYDGSYGYQCVDLIRHYAQYAEYPPITNRGNAIDLWYKGLGDGYTRVQNTLKGVPPIGAIVFWKQGDYGHVAIVGRANWFWMEVLEQNGGNGNGDGKGKNAIRLRKDFYTNCLGWFIAND